MGSDTQTINMAQVEAIYDIAGLLLRGSERVRPADLADEAGQLPLLIGPCFHCGTGYVLTLPSPCPRCGITLRRVVHPLWMLHPRLSSFYRRWLSVKVVLLRWTPESVKTVWRLMDAIATILARFRAGA